MSCPRRATRPTAWCTRSAERWCRRRDRARRTARDRSPVARHRGRGQGAAPRRHGASAADDRACAALGTASSGSARWSRSVIGVGALLVGSARVRRARRRLVPRRSRCSCSHALRMRRADQLVRMLRQGRHAAEPGARGARRRSPRRRGRGGRAARRRRRPARRPARPAARGRSVRPARGGRRRLVFLAFTSLPHTLAAAREVRDRHDRRCRPAHRPASAE